MRDSRAYQSPPGHSIETLLDVHNCLDCAYTRSRATTSVVDFCAPSAKCGLPRLKAQDRVQSSQALPHNR
eukprot:7225927-Pyramimonas_sp.AAC.1